VIPAPVGIEISADKPLLDPRQLAESRRGGDPGRSRCGCRTDGRIELDRHRSEDATSARESIRRRSTIICASMF